MLSPASGAAESVDDRQPETNALDRLLVPAAHVAVADTLASSAGGPSRMRTTAVQWKSARRVRMPGEISAAEAGSAAALTVHLEVLRPAVRVAGTQKL
jgi:hypothetical protein